MLRRLFSRATIERGPVDYEKSKRIAHEGDAKKRAEIASREDTQPEILYYLAEDQEPEVRRRIARNIKTPIQADALLAKDERDEVRCDIARKIARLVPDLSDSDQGKLCEMTIEVLEILAQDQFPRVRQIVAEELKHTDKAPRHVIQKLARDVEYIVAAPILEYSPLLSDDDLLEILGQGPVQGALGAISRRQQVSDVVADVIVDTFDVAAVGELLANPNAQIREETLDRIIEQAPEVERWHEPLVRRPELSTRAILRIAGFVASSLVSILVECHDLDEGTAAELTRAVKRRLKESKETDDVGEGERAKRAFEAGEIDDTALCDELDDGASGFVVHALALKADMPVRMINRIVESASGKAVTALAWRAGFEMRTAMRLQGQLAHISHRETVNARSGVDYPLTPEEMNWHLEYFTG